MELYGFEGWRQRDQHPDLRDAWISSEDLKSRANWEPLPGICELCGATGGFVLAQHADKERPDVRESLLCASCGHNARVRAGLRLMLNHLQGEGRPRLLGMSARVGHAGGRIREFFESVQRRMQRDQLQARPRIYLTEQVTPTFLWLQRHLLAELHGSEYEPDPARLRTLTQRFRRAGGRGRVEFRDVTNLAFKDACLDAIVSFDVLEHVPDYAAAITEFARTLKPGGLCVATFPFTDQPDTLVRARLNASGNVEHLMEPEYHGDPISGGVLCFYHFGWDVLDRFRSAGFRDVRMVMPWAHEHGCLYGLWTLLAIR